MSSRHGLLMLAVFESSVNAKLSDMPVLVPP